MQRRSFLKISAATFGGTVGGAASAGSLFNKRSPSSSRELPGRGDVEKSPTYCEICFWKCAGWVHKENGQPWKITGNEQDQHSLGRFCTRGTGGMGSYTDPDRLKKPLIRETDSSGRQSFREASWDEALGFIAKKMKFIAEKYGPETMALFYHGSGGGFFKTLLKAYGSDAITAPSYAQCRGPREEAFYLTFGEGIGSPERMDIKNSRCLVLIGSHLGENLHNTQVQEFSQAIENGASIIAVDPRFSVAAGKAKYWLPIKPATDNALLLAWIHVIIKEKLYNREFVENNTIGLEELAEAVKNNTPEWAYTITTIKPDVIRETAREMARCAPATIVHPSRHVTWYGDDTQRVRAVAILNALLGSWGAKGGFYLPVTASVPGFPLPEFPKPKKSAAEIYGNYYPLTSLLLASGVCDATSGIKINGDKPTNHYKGWIVYGTNLLRCLPNPSNTRKAIENLELMVAIDTMPAEITGYADVVLPECTYLERYDDIRVSQGRSPQIALRAPAFEPKYDSKPGWWIAKTLANKLGLGKFFPWKHVEEYLDHRLKAAGTSLDEMKRIGVKTWTRPHGLFVPPGTKMQYNTPSGKIELYSKQLATYGFDPVPKYTAHEEPPSGHYRLLYGRAPAHTFGRTVNNPLLNQLMPENEVWVHPAVAADWGIKPGARIKLINQDGVESLPIRAKVTERIRHDCIYMVHGFGHTDPRMKRCYKKGADDSELVTRVHVDPIMGGTGMRGNFVTFMV